MSKTKQPSAIAKELFDAAHAVAIKEYKKFWMELFENHGFAITNHSKDWTWATFNISYGGEEFTAEVGPAHYTGVKISHSTKYGGYLERKIMTSNGAVSWMKQNNVGRPPYKL